MEEIQKLEKEIAALENKLKKSPFGGLFDKGGRKRDENRLIKLQRELEQLKKGKK
ncbi:MAG: hypothetical protein JW763_05455 [candidate division Zixibacteria bacterium]|nr:hypothetical protein [candidate division Zixibacteria bacterium]